MSDKKFNVQINCNITPLEAIGELEAILGQKQFNINEGAIIVSLIVKIREGLSTSASTMSIDEPTDPPHDPSQPKP